MNYYLIGLVGVINLGILALITIWRCIRFLVMSGHIMGTKAWQKKVIFHFLLVLAVVVDIPMYISFIVIGDYSLPTYSFHKLESVFLLAAYSMTIHDWSTVLYDINEMNNLPLFFTKIGLILINSIFAAISIMNFTYCWVVADLDAFTDSPIYVVAIFMQIFAAFFLTSMMLRAGLSLSVRIQGVSGVFTLAQRRSELNMQAYNGFQRALNRLIIVMSTCVLCIAIQMLLLLLNYVLGYERRPNVSVGPYLFFWTFYAWVPIWGPILALLHLSRTRLQKGESASSPILTPQQQCSGHRDSNLIGELSDEQRESKYRPPDYPSTLFPERDPSGAEEEESPENSFADYQFTPIMHGEGTNFSYSVSHDIYQSETVHQPETHHVDNI